MVLYRYNRLDDNFLFLQDGIQPMWEDDKNKKGGRWLINLNKQQRSTDLDNFWLEMVRIFMWLLLSLPALEGSSGKVMFSVVIVCLSVILFKKGDCPNCTGVEGLGPLPPSRHVQLWPYCIGTHSPGHVQTCSLWSTHGWQAGSSHPTGMLSCTWYIHFGPSTR